MCVVPDGKLRWLSAGVRDGMLMKRGRDNGQFLSRRFVLSEREGTLKYFTKYDVSIDFFLAFVFVCDIDVYLDRGGRPKSERERLDIDERVRVNSCVSITAFHKVKVVLLKF